MLLNEDSLQYVPLLIADQRLLSDPSITIARVVPYLLIFAL